MVERSLIDCHVHLAALPEGQNGCYISPHMLKSPLFRFLLWKHGLSLYGWSPGRGGGFCDRYPQLCGDKGTLKIPHADAARIPDEHLRDLVRAVLEP